MTSKGNGQLNGYENEEEEPKTTYALMEELLHCLYFYEDETKSRIYAKFCEKSVHRQPIYKPILKIQKEHLSEKVRKELILLKKDSPEAFKEVVTDAVIRLYEVCNTTSFNKIVERKYARWVIV